MSRTKHHRNQRGAKDGVDFGSRYKCDRRYNAGTGPNAKNRADRERRGEAKDIIRRVIQ